MPEMIKINFRLCYHFFNSGPVLEIPPSKYIYVNKIVLMQSER